MVVTDTFLTKIVGKSRFILSFALHFQKLYSNHRSRKPKLIKFHSHFLEFYCYREIIDFFVPSLKMTVYVF